MTPQETGLCNEIGDVIVVRETNLDAAGLQDCIPMEISGEERKEAILGTLPSTKDFRFEFREKF